MNKQKPRKRYLALSLFISMSVSAAEQTVVYTESFDPAPESFIEFNMQLGGDPAQRPLNTRIVSYGTWVTTANGAFVNIGGDNGFVLQPQLAGRNNGRVGGIFLDPEVFSATGAGTYTLSFDVIPTSDAGAGRLYIGAGSGYDLSGETDAKLTLNLSADGFGVRRPTGLNVWPALTASGGATATHLITTSTEWILADGTATGEFRDTPGIPLDITTAATLSVDFEYDGISAIAIAFGGYNTDFKVDNLRISIAVPADDGFWAGYPVDEEGFVDTGIGFLGTVWVGTREGWALIYSPMQFIYAPEEGTEIGVGGWVYFTDTASLEAHGSHPLWNFSEALQTWVAGFGEDFGTGAAWVYVVDGSGHAVD